MFSKVLVSLHDHEISPGILPHVSYLARGLNLPLLLVSIVDPEAPAEESQSTQQWLEGYTQVLKDQGVAAQALLAPGSGPAQEILRQAEERQCDLIAMATRDRNFLGQAVMGSVTNEVIRSTRTPVLAITPEKREQSDDQARVTSILVPLDGTPFAEAALPYVEFLAGELGLDVVLARVLRYDTIYPPLVSADMAAVPRTAEVLGEVEKAVEDECVEYLQALAQKLGAKGLKVSWEVLRGPVSASIATLAQELPESMIALASHGRSGLLRWVMGSVAEELLRETGNPVLIIASTADEDEAGDER
jgi:nucleotide-binding universal stress UspA family protein